MAGHRPVSLSQAKRYCYPYSTVTPYCDPGRSVHFRPVAVDDGLLRRGQLLQVDRLGAGVFGIGQELRLRLGRQLVGDARAKVGIAPHRLDRKTAWRERVCQYVKILGVTS